jgi:choline dehydrogenase-like flavoprotein
MFGSRLPQKSFPVQLAATLAGSDTREMISLYYPGALPRADLAADMPLPYSTSLSLLTRMLGGVLAVQVWLPVRLQAGNTLTLAEDGSIRIDFRCRPRFDNLSFLLRQFRRIGAYSLPRLASESPPGWGFHYAGCLPMRVWPQTYETHVDGRLWDSRRVRVVDASVLPSLPAKNHSLSMMANAARIAEEALCCGY